MFPLLVILILPGLNSQLGPNFPNFVYPRNPGISSHPFYSRFWNRILPILDEEHNLKHSHLNVLRAFRSATYTINAYTVENENDYTIIVVPRYSKLEEVAVMINGHVVVIEAKQKKNKTSISSRYLTILPERVDVDSVTWEIDEEGKLIITAPYKKKPEESTENECNSYSTEPDSQKQDGSTTTEVSPTSQTADENEETTTPRQEAIAKPEK